MSIKRILLPLPGSASHAGEIDTALTTAKALGAYVEALFISEPPPATRHGVSARAFGSVAVAATVNWYAEEREKLAGDAREQFARACAAAGIALVADGEAAPALPAARWHESEGRYVDVAVERAAAFDLMIAASAAVMDSFKDMAERSLLQTRRPVLLAPARLQTALSDAAMIAWDESPECWHAMSAAIPLLRLARAVHLVSIDKNPASRRDSQAEAIAYLRSHDIAATPRVVAPHLRSVGDALLAAAGDEDTIGLMVMGAYSHSRLREMLLGGVTRHILQHASARPVLMAH